MEIKTDYYTTQKIARYSTYGTLSEKTKYFWFALHGSKMLCEQMLYKFKEFDPTEHFIVAPEALIRFYEKDFGGPDTVFQKVKNQKGRCDFPIP